MEEAHDALGHKGAFVIKARLNDRFWWPCLDQDVRWYIRTCHQCQVRQIKKIFIPPTVPYPASLFRRVYMDTMALPKVNGFNRFLHARCSMSAYPEGRALRSENANAIATFIFQDILCRWGAVEEIITDNGTPFIKALEILGKKYRIHHIRISAYNSRANGVVERQHRSAREVLVKIANGDETKWVHHVHSMLWSERVTIQKSTGHSPYWIAHGIEPLFPFDLKEATYMVPALDAPMTTTELVAIRARQLEKRPADLEEIANRIYKSRQQSVEQFIADHKKAIIDYDFEPGRLVLVRNSGIELDLSRKTKPRFFGPMLVVERTPRGAYVLAELDGAISKNHFAAFRIIPYYARSQSSIPVTKVVELAEKELAELNEQDTTEPARDEFEVEMMVDQSADDEDVGLDDEETGTSAGSDPTTGEPGPRRSSRLRA
jgi:hypothetical protein